MEKVFIIYEILDKTICVPCGGDYTPPDVPYLLKVETLETFETLEKAEEALFKILSKRPSFVNEEYTILPVYKNKKS